MPMKKTAMRGDSFRFYKEDQDPNAVEGEEGEEGSATPATPGSPAKKKKPAWRPVLTEDDLKKASPVLRRVMDLPKYQDIIKELRTATKNAKSGVVNFVTGMETEIVDAI